MPDANPKPTTRKRKRAKAKAAPAASGKARKPAAAAKRKTTASAKAKAAAAGKASPKRKATSARKATRPADLPREALKSLEDGQRAALDAVRKFAETLDSAMPLRGEGGPRRQEIVDSALEMAERLVQTQYDLLRRIMQSAGKPFGDPRKRG
jgi:hypothetical protein